MCCVDVSGVHKIYGSQSDILGVETVIGGVDMKTVFHRIKFKLHTFYWTNRTKLCKKEKLKNVIVFESKPDLSDNTRAVFDEMLRRGLNKQYKLVWMLMELDQPMKSQNKNVYILPQWDVQASYFRKIAKAKIVCNAFLEKSDERQICFYLSHGTGLKDVRHSYKLPEWMDYCIAAAPQLETRHAWSLGFDRSKTVGLGFPRNDVLVGEPASIKGMLGTNCSKVVVWYPTFRQHNCVKYTTVRNPIPPLDDIQCAEKLNEAAKQADILIVIKPHFAQDTQYIREMNLSNIQFIDDSFFQKNDIMSYEFVGACDALITDYSSIYFDYTLCDKPIAGIWSDIEEYKIKPGLVDDYEYLCKGMEKVYTLEELIAFIGRVGDGVDLLQPQRREIRDYSNYAADGSSTKRVVDFILEKISD